MWKFNYHVSPRDNCDWTPLQWASFHCRLDVAQQAIESGEFDVNASSSYGVDEFTPLMLCAIQGGEDVAKLLIRSGADVHRTSGENWTALHIASMNGNTKMVQVLLEDKGPELNLRTFTFGETPLHLACKRGHVEVVKQLLAAGCATDSLNFSNNTALCLFKGSNELYLEVIRLFIQLGGFLEDSDYARISKNPELNEHVLKDVELCSQSIVNKFHRQTLPAVYGIPGFAEMLPLIKSLKLNAQETQNIENSVLHDIQTNSFCNVVKARPIVLKLICVQSVLASCTNSKSSVSHDFMRLKSALAYRAHLKRSVPPNFSDSNSTSNKIRRN